MRCFRQSLSFIRRNKRAIIATVVAVIVLMYWKCLPDPLFNDPYSLVLTDKNNRLLGAMIAEDGQWRFPEDTSVPEKFEKCIIAFEDRRFYAHPGVDVLSVGRALKQNVSSMDRISGASTITMQVIRLFRNKPRTFKEKLIETVMATRLEIRYSKKEILALYASHAPFGGNVVGLNAASWRYFGKPASDLSWAEAATLAVLPNNPSMVHPGKNRNVLKKKRDRLLDVLVAEKIMDSTSCVLAKLEEIPEEPKRLPALTPHLLTRIYLERKQRQQAMQVIETTIDGNLQAKVNEVMHSHYRRWKENGVYNSAIIVADVQRGDVLAYCGNIKESERNSEVDNIVAPRSTGSILKPLLYASMLQDRKLYPDMLVPDVPTYINAYTPKNFNYTYDGAVPASRALARSLNIPAVHMLKEYTPERFHTRLKSYGIHTLKRPASAYGLSLILGGAEATLWDLASVYSSMARTLDYYSTHAAYRKNEFRSLNFYGENVHSTDTSGAHPVMSAGAIYSTFEALLKVSRPDEDKFWTTFSSGRRIAWKTGTSFGDRDAWSIGCTKNFVVAVWMGNSNGEGRTGLTGIAAAAPLMFDVFNLLPLETGWFKIPEKDLETIRVCSESGYAASDLCPDQREARIPASDNIHSTCPYHHRVHLDESESFRVHSECEKVSEMVHVSWFVLPPSLEKYYKLSHPLYKELPPLRKDCIEGNLISSENPMDMIYPGNYTRIYLPENMQGTKSDVVFEAVHTNLSATVYWHIDERYVGKTTRGNHELGFSANSGPHKVTLIDDAGNRLEQEFEIVN